MTYSTLVPFKVGVLELVSETNIRTLHRLFEFSVAVLFYSDNGSFLSNCQTFAATGMSSGVCAPTVKKGS
jgi:hypothetical protein